MSRAPKLPQDPPQPPVADGPAASTPAARREGGVLREISRFSVSTYRLTRGFGSLLKLIAGEHDVTRGELAQAIDQAVDGFYRHPLMRGTGRLTTYLRAKHLIPNEQSTEELLRYVVDQVLSRSPVPVPEALVQEFWDFFDELFSTPELKGLGELTVDMVRLVLRTYEPLLVEVINVLKAGRRFNEWQVREVLRRAGVVRHDLTIVRRQIKALRYIRPFFQTDPKDYSGQAQIVARMVGEFGPFFVKMAQVAAANADFLPEEIARELAVFHEDVPPMNPAEVEQAFMECYGKLPNQLFLDFDASQPVKSGSIGSVYFAKKPFLEDGREVLKPVVIKVGRHNIDREFAIGKMVLGLAIMSTQYWAPHSKLTPFLRAMQEQVDEFVAGFVEELDFESEAHNHQRFYERSLRTRQWRVPELYAHSHRILEMEYLSDAASLTRALARMGRRERRRFQAQVAERLTYAVLQHLLLYNEMHGDLHPGNVMVGSDGRLHLIDWGNVVALEGKLGPVWDYLVAVLLADTTLIANSLVRMSTQPEEHAKRWGEIKSALDETLMKKGVTPLTARNFLFELRRGGMEGLHRRGQSLLHLMSNTQQTGVVIKRDYLHLSRALFAAAGSFGSLYEDTSKRLLARDMAWSLARLPLTVTQDLLFQQASSWRQRLARRLPLPDFVRKRLRGPPKLTPKHITRAVPKPIILPPGYRDPAKVS
ncbi:ABC1 kinase family protein [Panacagrimonas sp.]|uniref:ABC1 kinase family protein n=1 Tax=Panacagrimonas sp. TaxID=2480088 RepID=UPI003B51BFB8